MLGSDLCTGSVTTGLVVSKRIHCRPVSLVLMPSNFERIVKLIPLELLGEVANLLLHKLQTVLQ